MTEMTEERLAWHRRERDDVRRMQDREMFPGQGWAAHADAVDEIDRLRAELAVVTAERDRVDGDRGHRVLGVVAMRRGAGGRGLRVDHESRGRESVVRCARLIPTAALLARVAL